MGPDTNWIRIQLLCGSGSIFRIHRIEDKNHRNAESENAPAVILFFLILKLTVFQIYFVFFFFLRCFCYCMKKSIKSLRSGTGSNRGKFLVPDPNSMFLIHKTGSNSNLALYLISSYLCPISDTLLNFVSENGLYCTYFLMFFWYNHNMYNNKHYTKTLQKHYDFLGKKVTNCYFSLHKSND